MGEKRGSKATPEKWTVSPDSTERFSTGIPDLDRLLGGGLRRGSLALCNLDATVDPTDHELLLTPMLLNFLHQSNGVIAVLPSRQSPHAFRAHLTRWVSRRRFDSRVRVVDYVGEDSGAPYVVGIDGGSATKGSPKARRLRGRADMAKMQLAETAVRGARSRMFLEMMAFEIAEILFGPEKAGRMFLHGIKRTREVGNLCLGMLRPGLGCGDTVRGMADIEFTLHRDDLGLGLRGIRPRFPNHLVAFEPQRGEPYVSLTRAP
ncbi:MAG TPA: gas vesicle protein GvpD basic region 2 domain-containing protein [Thermoplasmata archaeon]